MIAYILTAALVLQTGGFFWFARSQAATAAEERRFLINQALAETPQAFAIMSAAARPDETVEALAEARTARPSTPTPLGL